MVVTNRYEPDPRVHKEAVSLVAAGHRVRVYAFDRLAEMPVSFEISDGVEVHRLRVGRFAAGRMLSVAWGLRRFHAAVRKRLCADPPDVVHCHDQDTCAIGLWWQGQRGRSGQRGIFVFDAHDLYFTYPLMSELGSPLRRLARHAAAQLLKLAEQRYVRRADLLITVSESIGEHPGFAEHFRRCGARPLVIWNAPLSIEPAAPLPARFTVGYFGFVREPEMFRWLTEAIATLPPALRPAVRIAGGGVEYARVRALLEEAAKRLGFPLMMTGAFSMRELPQLMAQCSVQFCVYPLRSGNMAHTVPVKLFDAVAHGRKVIGNADTLMGDFITQRGWGHAVRQGDVKGLSAALQLLQRELSRRSMAPFEAPSALQLTPPPVWEDEAMKLCAAYARLTAAPLK